MNECETERLSRSRSTSWCAAIACLSSSRGSSFGTTKAWPGFTSELEASIFLFRPTHFRIKTRVAANLRCLLLNCVLDV